MKKRFGLILQLVVLATAIAGLVATLAAAKGEKEEGTHAARTLLTEEVMSTVKAALPRLVVGESFVVAGKRGEKRLEVPLLLGEDIVTSVRLDPGSGEILSKRLESAGHVVTVTPDRAREIVRQALPELEVSSVSLGKEGQWIVDLMLKKAVIAHIGVHGFTGEILPDRSASRHASLSRWTPR